MSEITDPIQATPYGIAVAGLLEIEDICDEVHDCDVSDIRAAAVKAREAASRVNADHIAAALLQQPADTAPKPRRSTAAPARRTAAPAAARRTR